MPPAAPTARLLGEVAPGVAATLAEIEYASMAIVTLAFRTDDVAGVAALHEGSGFLVPPVDGRVIKAATFSASKWGWVREAGAAEVLDAGDDTRGEQLERALDDSLAGGIDLAGLAGLVAVRSLEAASQGLLPELRAG